MCRTHYTVVENLLTLNTFREGESETVNFLMTPDGQVLVFHDMLGITQDFSPRFLRRYHNLKEEIRGSIQSYIADVKSLDFPNEREQY